MKTVLSRSTIAKLSGGRSKTTFSGKVKGVLRGTPQEADTDCFRALEDDFIRLLENGGFRLLESCPDEQTDIFDITFDITFS